MPRQSSFRASSFTSLDAENSTIALHGLATEQDSLYLISQHSQAEFSLSFSSVGPSSQVFIESLTAGPSLKFQEPRRPIAIHFSEEENWHSAKESLVLEYEEVKKKDNYSTSHPLYLQLLGLDLDKEE